MADESCPPELRTRVGKYTTTKHVDLVAGVFLYENRLNRVHNLFLREGIDWYWVMRASTNAEMRGLLMVLRRMGVEVQS